MFFGDHGPNLAGHSIGECNSGHHLWLAIQLILQPGMAAFTAAGGSAAEPSAPLTDSKGAARHEKPRDADQPSSKQDKPEAKITPEKKPHFLDPDYTGPSKKDLDRADQMDRAIQQHKARQARQRAAERRERDKDRDGPER